MQRHSMIVGPFTPITLAASTEIQAMTDINISEEAVGRTVQGPDDWVLIKAGYYYRPGAKGYTSELLYAGAYTEEDAKAREASSKGAANPVTAAPASSHMTATDKEVFALRAALTEANKAANVFRAMHEAAEADRDTYKKLADEAVRVVKEFRNMTPSDIYPAQHQDTRYFLAAYEAHQRKET